MKSRASIPINRRWPGKHAMRLALYRPDGSKAIEVETDLDDALTKRVWEIINEALGRPEVVGWKP